MIESTKRVPELDGIRGTAILLVLIWHFVVIPTVAGPHESATSRIIVFAGLLTWSGVDLFFVLSGFLIGGILIDARGSPHYFKTFYFRRVFRILPIYLLLVIGYLFLWSVAGGIRPILTETLGRPMPWYVYFSFTQNFWLAHRPWTSIYLTVSWSLAVEEQFYLLLPAIVRVLPRNRLLPVAAALALGSASARSLMFLHYGPSWGTAAYTLILSRADALMLGVICATVVRSRLWKDRLITNRWAINAALTGLGLGVAVMTYKGWGMETRPMCTLGFSFLALFYASLLMAVLSSPDSMLSRAFRTHWLRWLGTVAYGLYLFHSVALTVLFRILQGYSPTISNWRDIATILVSLVAALGVSWLSWSYFESKLVRVGHHFTYASK